MIELNFDGVVLEGLQYAAEREGITVEQFCSRTLSNLAMVSYGLKLARDKKQVIELMERGEIKVADCLALKAVKIEEPVIKEEPIVEIGG